MGRQEITVFKFRKTTGPKFYSKDKENTPVCVVVQLRVENAAAKDVVGCGDLSVHDVYCIARYI